MKIATLSFPSKTAMRFKEKEDTFIRRKRLFSKGRQQF